MISCGYVGLGPLGDSYFDYNVTAGCYFNVTFAFQYKASQGVHTYGGSGVGTGGGSASFTVGYNRDITRGTNCGLQGNLGFLPWGPGLFGIAARLGHAKETSRLNPFALRKASEGFQEYGISYGVGPRPFSFAATCYQVVPVRGLSW